MIDEALLGISAGALLAGGLSGLRRPRGWERATRIIAFGGALLALLAFIAVLVESRTALSLQAALTSAMLLIGGAFLAFKTETLPSTFIAGSLLLAYLTLAQPEAIAPSLDGLIAILASAITLPALDAAARELRRMPTRVDVSMALWLGVTVALVTHIALSMARRGAWIDDTPGAAWLLAAWIAASGSRLTQRGRPRALLGIAAALMIAFAAF